MQRSNMQRGLHLLCMTLLILEGEQGDLKSDPAVVEAHVKLSKRKGDYHFRIADMLSGSADWIPGQDDGEPPHDYEVLERGRA